MKEYYGYIRVSTVKQGQKGVSLQEQKDAILRYSQRSGIEITAWFEEQETAAKQGRPIFNKMLKQLRAGKAQGVVLHKIDRGARNLKDWASIAELNDQGIDVHLANDGLDMKSRGGRLSADIQAVIAADYIRNLREETLKGFYGRLKQGILPIGAPLGYLNNGGGKPKTPDPIKAPLMVKAFELYATGKYSFNTLPSELEKIGLRNLRGNPVTRSALTDILTNVFYIGLIRIKKTGEVFNGIHEPIIPKRLFDRVQRILAGKCGAKVFKHDMLFRRLLRCTNCASTLIGEKQKGHHYYRCHNKDCPVTSVREETVSATIKQYLEILTLKKADALLLRSRLKALESSLGEEEVKARAGLQLKLGQLRDRLNRLTDALIDGALDRDSFNSRKAALLLEQKDTEERMDTLISTMNSLPNKLEEFLELTTSLISQYETGILSEKRRILNVLTSNLSASREKVYFTMRSPYHEVLKLRENASSAHQPHAHRMLDLIIAAIQDHLKKESADSAFVDSDKPDSAQPP